MLQSVIQYLNGAKAVRYCGWTALFLLNLLKWLYTASFSYANYRYNDTTMVNQIQGSLPGRAGEKLLHLQADRLQPVRKPDVAAVHRCGLV